MRYLASVSLVSLLATGVTAAPAKRTALDSFGSRLYGEITKSTKTNVIYSPASILMAMAMTREGATDRTATEMDTVLGDTARAEVEALRKALLVAPPKSPDGAPVPPTLVVANRLYGDGATTFDPAFLDLTGKRYGAPLEIVDFRKDFEGARGKINTWVEQQTKDKIKNLLVKGTLDDSTRLVLVNAIYLKAQWATAFEKAMTKPDKFAVAGGTNRDLPTMHGVVGGAYGSHAGARTLDLPYYAAPGGPRLAMLIVVPDKAKLDAIEATFAKDGLQPFLAGTSSHGKIDVALPKFKVGADFSLGDTLDKMGMHRAFTDDAEFKAMTKATATKPAERLKISKVIHKAWAEVDEKGTEAAAATAVVMVEITSVSVPVKPIPFKVDRSFLFFIHDQNGTVLFGGRMIDPSI
ncbi:MAG: serpin family protein [Kofleriaceae bacterium]